MPSPRSIMVAKLSAWRSAAFQWVDGRPGADVLAHVFPLQLMRADPRAPDDLDPRVADLARPIRCPQRRSGVMTIDDLPAVESSEFARLITSARHCEDVVVDLATTAEAVAGPLVALAAAGVQVRIAPGRPVPAGVGADLALALRSPAGVTAHASEIRSIRLRRLALAELWNGAPAPTLSVLLASRRPDDVEAAIRQVLRQRGVAPQIAVGLHGGGWAGVEDRVAAMLPAGSVLERFDRAVPLGTVLNELVARSDGDLVAKWDDDDWYGDDHLADLVHAYRFSGADVVGKAAEFVHLEGPDVTIRRFAVGAEAYSTTIAGGAMMTSRSWLREVGGWAPVKRGVDRALIDETVARGGRAYRTHGFQYVLRRRADSAHTWRTADESFVAQATTRTPGLALGRADISALEASDIEREAATRPHEPEPVTGSQFDLIRHAVPDDEAMQVTEQYYVDRVIGSLAAGSMVLDVGCGEGKSRKMVSRSNPKVSWFGVDLPSSPEVDRRSAGRRDIVSFDGVALPFRSGSVDCVLSVQVLEHVRHPEPLLREIARVLAPGGQFIGTTSNLEPYHSYSFWNFTPYGMATILHDAGLEVIELRPGIDGPTLIERQILRRPPEMSKYFGSTSPRNAEFIAWGERTGRRPALVNDRMLQFSGHFGFLARRPVD